MALKGRRGTQTLREEMTARSDAVDKLAAKVKSVAAQLRRPERLVLKQIVAAVTATPAARKRLRKSIKRQRKEQGFLTSLKRTEERLGVVRLKPPPGRPFILDTLSGYPLNRRIRSR